MSVLVIHDIFGRFVNTLTPDDKYFVCNSDNLSLLSRIELSKTQKTFSQFFAPFLKSRARLKQFEEMTTLVCYLFSKLKTSKELVGPIFKKSG